MHGQRASVARVCIMFNYKKNIYSLKIFKIMSICCAFSFSLIFFVLFCFPWDGVGEACAGVVNIFGVCLVFFCLFVFGFDFFFWKAFTREVGFLLFLQFLYVHSLQFCVCIHCWQRTHPLACSS